MMLTDIIEYSIQREFNMAKKEESLNMELSGDIGQDLKKISVLLESVLNTLEKDRQRSIEHYDNLKDQLDKILEFQHMSDEGAIEREMTKILGIINDSTVKTIKPILASLSKIVSTQIQAETLRNMGGGFNPNKRLTSAIDIHSLLEESSEISVNQDK